MDNKKKDSDVIKALNFSKMVAINIGSVTLSKNDVLAIDDLINRQKEEIERLENWLDSSISSEANTVDSIPYERAEAITAYMEEVERRCIKRGIYPVIIKNILHNVKEEMI